MLSWLSKIMVTWEPAGTVIVLVLNAIFLADIFTVIPWGVGVGVGVAVAVAVGVGVGVTVAVAVGVGVGVAVGVGEEGVGVGAGGRSGVTTNHTPATPCPRVSPGALSLI